MPQRLRSRRGQLPSIFTRFEVSWWSSQLRSHLTPPPHPAAMAVSVSVSSTSNITHSPNDRPPPPASPHTKTKPHRQNRFHQRGARTWGWTWGEGGNSDASRETIIEHLTAPKPFPEPRPHTSAGWLPAQSRHRFECRYLGFKRGSKSSGLPKKAGIRWCTDCGRTSLIDSNPVVATPPASSTIIAIGLPFGTGGCIGGMADPAARQTRARDECIEAGGRATRTKQVGGGGQRDRWRRRGFLYHVTLLNTAYHVRVVVLLLLLLLFKVVCQRAFIQPHVSYTILCPTHATQSWIWPIKRKLDPRPAAACMAPPSSHPRIAASAFRWGCERPPGRRRLRRG